MQELLWAIRKLKRRKAIGPDDTPIEFYKEMEIDSLQHLRHMLNQWWNNEHIPEDQLLAQVVLIYKKGPKDDLSNYRPISLLKIMYNILAAALQTRIEHGVEDQLHKTQYGSRKCRSTGQALYI